MARNVVVRPPPPVTFGPCEWHRAEVGHTPANVLIKSGAALGWGDWSVWFHGTDTGVRFDKKPWVVKWRGAIGTTRPQTAYFEHRRFRLFRDAVRCAKAECIKQLRRLR